MLNVYITNLYSVRRFLNSYRKCMHVPADRSGFYLNFTRTVTLMAENSDNCQSHTLCAAEDVADCTNIRELDVDKQTSEEQQKTNKKRKVQHKSKEKHQKPNYFVGIKVCNQEVVENAEKVQLHMVNKHKALEGALIALPTLHLTLAVIHLNDEDEELKKKASEAMEHCHKECGPGLMGAPLTLTFEGLGHFPSGVVFSKVKDGDELNKLTQIARQVQDSFMNHGITLLDKGFTPHLTLLKTSKLHCKWNEIKKIKKTIREDLYDEYKDLLFGTEEILHLQLLSMNKAKDENGYYPCLKSICFGKEP